MVKQISTLTDPTDRPWQGLRTGSHPWAVPNQTEMEATFYDEQRRGAQLRMVAS